MKNFKSLLPKILFDISRELEKIGAKPIIVGGSIRDFFLNLPIKDYDIEVYGINSIEDLEKILSGFGKVNLVGKSFGVLKFIHHENEYDFSLPRTDIKIGSGHKGFSVTCNGDLGFKEASKRRDFTINSIGYDMQKDEFLDPFGGLQDIRDKVVKAVDDSAFIEDPLRVYRAVQFCSRFDFRLDDKTLKLCVDMISKKEFISLPKERIFAEFKKMLLKSKKPSIGFELMRKIGILSRFPELENIINVQQDPIKHPEGDVWTHTMMVVDEMSKLKSGDEKQDLKFMFAALCHDLGKATHTQKENGKLRAIGHEEAGVELTKNFLYRLTGEHSFINSVSTLVKYHAKPLVYFRNHARDKTIRELSTKVNISELVTFAKADFLGRTAEDSLEGVFEAGEWLLEKAKELGVENHPPKNFVKGQDLIDMGLEPSEKFKKILDQIYDKQLSGEIRSRNEALTWLTKIINL